MEDLIGPVVSPQKPAVKVAPNPPESPKKYDWKDHDPYKLPDVDMKARIAAAAQSDRDGDDSSLDPRLATEEELRHFIETMRPEDFDANSPAFRELPTETQYEIIGDLRLKSRQTSHSRLQEMLKASRTAMDFSKAQIRGLHGRNRLTQQLLMTTNTMGKEIDYHLTIPIRIAAERNREYVLIKNEGPAGGWSLGIKDEGTKEKPIQVQPDSDDDDDMEEVPINEPAYAPSILIVSVADVLQARVFKYVRQPQNGPRVHWQSKYSIFYFKASFSPSKGRIHCTAGAVVHHLERC